MKHNKCILGFVLATLMIFGPGRFAHAQTVLTANAGGPYYGAVGTEITFDAGGSSSPSGVIVSYEWDWNEDGVYEDTVAAPTIAHTWNSPYSGTVGLRVTDDQNGSATTTAMVTVHLPLELSVSPSSGLAPLTVTFTLLNFPDGSGDLYIHWIYGDGTERWTWVGGDGWSFPHTYGASGTYIASAELYDDNDRFIGASAPTTVQVTAPKLVIGGIDQAEWQNIVQVPLTLTTLGTAIAGIGEDIQYDPEKLEFIDATLGDAAASAGKTITYEQNPQYNCWNDCGWPAMVRVLVIDSYDKEPIPDGVVAHLNFRVLPSSPLEHVTTIAGCPSATSPLDPTTGQPEAVYIDGANGQIGIHHTWGDCTGADGVSDGSVAIEDVMTAIDMFLEVLAPQPCADRDASGFITIEEVQYTINMFLGFPVTAFRAILAAELARRPKPSLILRPGKAKAGEKVKIPMVFRSNGAGVSSLSMDIGYDPRQLTHPRVVMGPSARKANKNVVMSHPKPGLLRVAVIGPNADLLSDGVAGYVVFKVKPNARVGRTYLQCGSSASSGAGESLAMARPKRIGSVRILNPLSR